MKIEKNNTRIVLSVISVLAFGILVGYSLGGNSVFMEGALYNAAGEATTPNATTPNATTPNATTPNATTPNATTPNATTPNASDANASSKDNILYLYQLDLSVRTATAGDTINITLGTGGACNSGATIIFKNESSNEVFTTTVESINNNPYIVIPKNVIAGKYKLTDILLTGINSDNTTFTRQYGESLDDNSIYADFGIELELNVPVVNTSEVKSDNSGMVLAEKRLESITVNSSTAKVGDKVYVNIKTKKDIKSVKLIFKSDTDSMIVYLKSLSNKPYFEVPTNTKTGTYKLTGVSLKSDIMTETYTGINEPGLIPFELNSTIKITDGNSKSYVYNNEDINKDVIYELYNANNNKGIIVNASSNPIINSELFNVIKGKDKKLTINYNDNQIVFNGKDITDAKTIDASVVVDKVDNSEDISKLINGGLVVNFKDNGTLPGKALVRIKLNDDLKRELNNKVYVYYYDDIDNNFNLIASNVKKSLDGYYQFTISHNSSYVLVNNKLDSKLVSSDNSNVVSFQKSNKLYLLLIGVGVVVVIGAIVVIMIAKKNNNKKTGAHSKINNDKKTDKKKN